MTGAAPLSVGKHVAQRLAVDLERDTGSMDMVP